MDVVGKDSVFIIDGYPRNEANLNAFKEVFGVEFQLVCTLYLTCDEDKCSSRILTRGESSGRSDDNAEVLKRRFATFYKESLPVIDLLKEVGPIIEVDSTLDKNEVSKNICNELSKFL
jgi:adenylate kinase family enzyme